MNWAGGKALTLAWIVAVAVALGADAFSLALAIGLVGMRKRLILRLSAVVALFHIFMPLGGLVIGQTLGQMLGRLARAIGALVLVWLGARMLYSAYRPGTERFTFEEARRMLFRGRLPAGVSLEGWGIYALALSVSLDALSVGFSLGTVDTPLAVTVLIMGGVAGLMTISGLVLGRFVGTWLGKRAEILGGLALALIGIRLFF